MVGVGIVIVIWETRRKGGGFLGFGFFGNRGEMWLPDLARGVEDYWIRFKNLRAILYPSH